MVRLIQPNECDHFICTGSVSAGIDIFGNPLLGGEYCICHCHYKLTEVYKKDSSGIPIECLCEDCLNIDSQEGC